MFNVVAHMLPFLVEFVFGGKPWLFVGCKPIVGCKTLYLFVACSPICWLQVSVFVGCMLSLFVG